jgi:hypothetical protein
MTTPEERSGKRRKSRKGGEAESHLRRPELKRSSPKRAMAAGEGVAHGYQAGPDPSSAPKHDPSISESVAHAVKAGYDVITENIQQGREAAARFRQGQYNVRDVPGDLEVVALRLVQLARELSTTTLDICERLLKEIGAQRPPTDRAAAVPPFREPSATGYQVGPEEPGLMKLTVRFTGRAKAASRTSVLARPRRPTSAGDLSVTPLARRDGEGKPIRGVNFESDVSVEGLIANVAVPTGQAPGVYSGLVYAKDDDVPLGPLTVEIPK